MLFIDLLLAVLVALLFAMLLAGAFGWRHPRHPGTGVAAVFLFLVLLPVVWAGGVWITPVGPMVGGSAWVPFILVGLLVALIIAAIGSSPPPPADEKVVDPNEPQPDAADAAAAGIAVVFSLFFWLLILGGIFAIVAAYID